MSNQIKLGVYKVTNEFLLANKLVPKNYLVGIKSFDHINNRVLIQVGSGYVWTNKNVISNLTYWY